MDPRSGTIGRLLTQVEYFVRHQDWDEAAVRCYQILAIEPSHREAQNMLQAIYLQPDLIADMRRAAPGLFAAEDASPHQQRRRLAFSYRVLSRWPGWLRDDEEQSPPVDELEEAAQIISHAYHSGDDCDLLTAWEMYVQACARHPRRRYAIEWWMAKQYAAHGFFADASEVLTEMLSQVDDDADAQYVLAEIHWWRDHAESLAWIADPAAPR